MSKIGSVSGLRAMFESGGKEENSPPERGRSPGLSAGTESPRPLSKIRTNFVAVVEKDGRVGLKRDPSSDSVLSSSKKTSEDGDKPANIDTLSQSDPPLSFAEKLQQQKKPLQMETIPQSPLHNSPKPTQDVTFSQSTATDSGQNGFGSTKDKTADSAQAEGSAATALESKSGQGPNPNGKAAVERDKPKAANKASPAKANSGATEAKTPKALSVATTKTSSRPARSPTATKTPTSPTKGVKLPSKTPEKRTLDPQKSATAKMTPKAVSKAISFGSGTASHTRDSAVKTSSLNKKPPTVQISPSDTLDRGVGFVKPKPKSPTRPVALPAGLTTHTAASATRTGSSRSSLSRQSGSYQNGETSRSPSRTSTMTGKTLRRQSSSINRPRPSIGPPPKATAVDHPVTKREKPVDDGFLARMMRPTQASSSKTHEKATASPPRKAPGIGNTTKRPVANKDTLPGAAKKAVARTEGPTRKVSSKPIASKKSSEPEEEKGSTQKVATSKTTEKPKSQGVAAKVGGKPESAKVSEAVPESVPKTKEPDVVPAEASKVEPVVVELSKSSEAVANLVTDIPELAPASVEPIESATAVQIAASEGVPIDTETVSVDYEAAGESMPAISAADSSLAETSSEKEPTEPKTPVDVTEFQESTGAIDHTSEESKANKDELEIQKQEDGATMVAN